MIRTVFEELVRFQHVTVIVAFVSGDGGDGGRGGGWGREGKREREREREDGLKVLIPSDLNRPATNSRKRTRKCPAVGSLWRTFVHQGPWVLVSAWSLFLW